MKSTESFKRPQTWEEAQEAKRVAHGLPVREREEFVFSQVHDPNSFDVLEGTMVTDCVLVQPDPNAHLGATEE